MHWEPGFDRVWDCTWRPWCSESRDELGDVQSAGWISWEMRERNRRLYLLVQLKIIGVSIVEYDKVRRLMTLGKFSGCETNSTVGWSSTRGMPDLVYVVLSLCQYGKLSRTSGAKTEQRRLVEAGLGQMVRTAVDGTVLAHIAKIIKQSFQLLFWPWCKICQHLLSQYYCWLCFSKDYALCTQDFIHSEACITILGLIWSRLKIHSTLPMTVEDGRHSVRLE